MTLSRCRARYLSVTEDIAPFKLEFSIVIFIHYKSRIAVAVAIRDL